MRPRMRCVSLAPSSATIPASNEYSMELATHLLPTLEQLGVATDPPRSCSPSSSKSPLHTALPLPCPRFGSPQTLADSQHRKRHRPPSPRSHLPCSLPWRQRFRCAARRVASHCFALSWCYPVPFD